MISPDDALDYTYAHSRTEATTGYFSCEPPAALSWEAALERLEACPLDDFLHQHCLRTLAGRGADALKTLAATAYDAAHDAFRRPVLAALVLECALLVPELAAVAAAFPPDAALRLAAFTPLVYLRAAACPDAATARQWSELFRRNICDHHALPQPEDVDLPPLYDATAIDAAQEAMRAQAGCLAAARGRVAALGLPAWERPPAQETFLRATDALLEAGILAGPEMRHQASLSPIALLRTWRLDLRVSGGTGAQAVRHSLRGEATAYGRGLSLAQARASYSMEIVERASAYVDIRQPESANAPGEVGKRKQPLPVIRASYAALLVEGRAALSPERLPLDAPFAGSCGPETPLHWVPAHDPAGGEVLVPAQAVFLFCNLEEPSLFLAAGSTGLASGNTVEEAKVAALVEILERDAEATTPFSRRQCFTLCSQDALLQSLLDDYAARGIRLQFQDMTTEFGIPVYQCFVMSRRGVVVRATGAGLSGRKAALAALTETPWPYPYGEPTGPALAALPQRCLEELPEWELDSPAANLRLLEELLDAQGRTPLYVDLTRSDLDIPVVRAIIPGLELTGEPDSFSRPSPRLMARYLRETDERAATPAP